MKLTNSHRDRHMFLNDNEKAGTSCIVFTRRFLSPIHIRSNRKVASQPKTSKLCSSKRLHSIVVLTSVTCAGNRHCRIKVGTCMAQKKFAQADSKTGSKIRIKNRSPH